MLKLYSIKSITFGHFRYNNDNNAIYVSTVCYYYNAILSDCKNNKK